MKRIALILIAILFLLAPLASKLVRATPDCLSTCIAQGEYMYYNCRDAGLTAEECQGIYVASFCGCYSLCSGDPYPQCP